jgi:CRISPR-associated protein Cmr3
VAKPHKKPKHKTQPNRPSNPQTDIATNPPPSSDDTLTARFQAHDTWFFRESRPHDAVGASELISLFPPPVRTLAGALRTYFGESIGIDWQTMQSSQLPDFDFQTALGGPEDLGKLQLQGPWIVHDGQRLYPAPLYLMHAEKDSRTDIQRLHIGSPVHCDLGRVRLPTLPSGLQGYKTLEQRWLTANGLVQCLNGQVPAQHDLFSAADLFDHEARLGIARDNAQRTVQQGQLYQTQHLRIKPKVHIDLDLRNLDPALGARPSPSALIRLGGEGRMAGLQLTAPGHPLPFAKPKTVETLLIHFLTPADFQGHWHPADFQVLHDTKQTYWQGVIQGIALRIEAAVIGKVHREGGWDMKNHKPRAVKSYIPAGSAWFCRLAQPTDWQTLATALHGQCVGQDTALGRGQIAIGHWTDSFNI